MYNDDNDNIIEVMCPKCEGDCIEWVQENFGPDSDWTPDSYEVPCKTCKGDGHIKAKLYPKHDDHAWVDVFPRVEDRLHGKHFRCVICGIAKKK